MIAYWLLSLIIGGAAGLLMGRWIARDSIQRKPIQGGQAAKLLHYLACSALVAGAPSALVATLLYGQLHALPRLLRASAVGFADVLLAGVLLIGFAIFEARAPQS